MKKVFRFLASIRFTLFLIGGALLFVIAGTFIESASDSHGQAVRWIYHNPLFFLFLGGFFVNILGSALTRWPFKRRHFPFLIAHLALLMVISGIFVKALWGVQGQLIVLEGSGSHEILLPNSHALLVKDPKGAQETFPLKKLPSEIKMTQLISHSEMGFDAWVKGGVGVIEGFAPLPLSQTPHIQKAELDGKEIELVSLETDDWKRALRELYLDGLSIEVKENGEPYILFPLKRALEEESILKAELLLDNEYPHLEFAGLTLPLSGSQALIERGELPLTLELHRTPRICLVAVGEDRWIFAFGAHGTLAVFPFEEEKIETLLVKEGRYVVQAPLSKEDLFISREEKIARRQETLRGIYHEEIDMEREAFVATLEEADRKGEIDLSALLPNPESQIWVLEGPLTPRFTPRKSLKKLEDNRPLLTLQVGEETVSLRYDAAASGIMWPIANSNYQVRFQPEKKKIPYHTRLHDVRKINYPGTGQPYSYESRLTFTDRKGNQIEKTLSMNHVYQTWDGYRFYLGSLSPDLETEAQKASIVVNRDPARYWLTYPGAFLLALGFLLFYKQKITRQQ